MVEQLSLPGMDVPPAESTTGRCSTIDLSQPPRLRHVDRAQVLMMLRSLDDSLPTDHDARVIGDAVAQLNFEKFESTIAARGSAPGRAATDPRILAALWLYGATKVVGSGREAQPEEVRVSTTDPHASKTRDSDFTIAWRQRMMTEKAKTIYKKTCIAD